MESAIDAHMSKGLLKCAEKERYHSIAISKSPCCVLRGKDFCFKAIFLQPPLSVCAYAALE